MAKAPNNYDVKAGTYRKDSGEVSDRNLVVLSEGGNVNMFAYDVSTASAENVAKLQEILRRQKQELKDFSEASGIELKSFKPGNFTPAQAVA